VVWPGSTAPTLTTTANAVDALYFVYDGTNYYGRSDLAYGATGPGIALDNAASSTYRGSSGTLSFATGGTNRILIVSTAENPATSVTYNGTSMTKATSTIGTSIWYLINPASGTHDIVVNASHAGFSLSAVSLDNVDQSTGIGAVATRDDGGATTASSGSLSLSTTHANSWIVDSLYVNTNSSAADRHPTATGSNQTLRSAPYINYSVEYGNGAQSTEMTTGTGSYTTSYSWTNSDWWTMSSVEVLPY